MYFITRQNEVIPKTKRYIFGFDQFTKQLKIEGKFNLIDIDKSKQKDMVIDKVGLTNDILV